MLWKQHISAAWEAKEKRPQQLIPAPGVPSLSHQGFESPDAAAPKHQRRSASSSPVTTRASLTLCKCFYVRGSCWIQNGKLLLRDVHRILLFQQERKLILWIHCILILWQKKASADLTLRTLRPTPTKKPPKTFWGKKQPDYYRFIFIDNDLQANILLLKTGYNNKYNKNVVQAFSRLCFHIFHQKVDYLKTPTESLRSKLVLLRAQSASTNDKHYCSFDCQKVSKGWNFCTNTLNTVITVVAQLRRRGQEADPAALTPTTEDTGSCDEEWQHPTGRRKENTSVQIIHHFRKRSADTTWLLMLLFLI